jgi:hypothetical protein
VTPWRRKFSRLNVLFICYGTAVEHMSLLNRSGICDGINRCNIFFVHAAVLSIKTAFNLVKIHLLSRIIPLIQWSVMFCRPCFNRFWGLKYISRLFSEYYVLFSYQTGYIMWHSRLKIYIPWGAAEGNIYHKLGMSHYIPCLTAE